MFEHTPTDEWQWQENADGQQMLPVNIFESENDLVVVAPLPGMEPENLDVVVAGKTLTIRSGLRGPGQDRRNYLRHEWRYGPYFRQIALPVAVDPEHANASFGNGILTLTLPKTAVERTQRIVLHTTGTVEGHYAGHKGRSEGRARAAGAERQGDERQG